MYYNMIKDAPDPKKQDDELIIQGTQKSIDDIMLKESAKRYSIAFEQQFHYGCVYGYIKLKELEIKNIMLICDVSEIHQSQENKAKKDYILPFNY